MGKEIVSYVKRHLSKYPKMETIDIFKLLYQEVFLYSQKEVQSILE